MRKLSELGIIEDITIVYCPDFNDETNALVFNELKSIEWQQYETFNDDETLNFLKAMTRAVMPRIDTFSFSSTPLNKTHCTEVLALLKSKKSLKNIKFWVKEIENPFPFLNKIIEILKTYPNRVQFKLDVPSLSIKEAEVSL